MKFYDRLCCCKKKIIHQKNRISFRGVKENKIPVLTYDFICVCMEKWFIL